MPSHLFLNGSEQPGATIEGNQRAGPQPVCHQAQRALGLAGEVNIYVTSNREMQELNRRYRRKEQAHRCAVVSVASAGRCRRHRDLAGDCRCQCGRARTLAGHRSEDPDPARPAAPGRLRSRNRRWRDAGARDGAAARAEASCRPDRTHSRGCSQAAAMAARRAEAALRRSAGRERESQQGRRSQARRRRA